MSLSARSIPGWRRTLVVVLTCALGVLGLSAPQWAHADTNPALGTPETVSADALPTWQITGVVWSQVVVGNTVYATGSFLKARPPGVTAGGVGEIPVGNLIAYDITTGNLIAAFNHTLNAQGMVVTASPDGKRLFVGGDFTAVDGTARPHVAMFNITDPAGVLDTGFFPYVGGQVRALGATNSQVYVGGAYTVAGGTTRNRLAAFTNAGVLLPWAPSADDNNVWSLVIAPDGSRVIVGGAFTTLNGQPTYGMGSTDAVTGASLPWAINQTVRDAGNFGAIVSLTTDGTKIYGSGYSYGSGTNFEGTFAAAPSTGAMIFANDCHGDTYDTFPMGQVLYSVSHSHDCTWMGGYPDTSPRVRWEHALAQTSYPTGTNTGPDSYGWNYNGMPSSTLLHFFPQLTIGTVSGQEQAAWSVKGNSSYVVMGGEFPSVNGTAQQGLVRFAVKSIATNKRGPTYVTNPTTPIPATTATSLVAGTARISFGTAWDYDNESLTYDLRRDGVAFVKTAQLKSSFWNLPRGSFTDTGLVPGSTHSYQIRITDPFGNTQWSPLSNTVTISSTSVSAYAQDVLNDGASAYWRLSEPSGTTVVDWAGGADAIASSGLTRSQVGALTGDPDTASKFSGTTTGQFSTTASAPGPQSFTLEAWVRTNSSQGGKIIGYGSAQTGNSTTYDRQLYLDNAGHIWFGVYSGSAKTISSPGTYRNNVWHHVVASLDVATGMTLYIDGAKIAGDLTTTSAQPYNGYWRVGGDNLASWPSRPSSAYVNGSIDEVAVYPAALTLTKVQRHFLDAGGSLPNQSPTASFTSSSVGELASFDGTASSDLEAPIASYSWNFGDGTPAGTGVTPSHPYAVSGTYQVTLTVTDRQAATGSVTKPVTVTVPPPNQGPTASFTSSAVNLIASFDGSGSTDPDGAIASYSWDFGDGTTGTGAAVSHQYAIPASYDTTLTVTDNRSGTGVVIHSLTVTGPLTLGSDDFGRTTTTGWSTADLGGAWTTASPASSFAVNGGVGKITAQTAGAGPSNFLNTVSSSDTDIQTQVSIGQAPSGTAGVDLSLVGRKVGTSGDYRGKVRLMPGGAVRVSIASTDSAGASTVIVPETTIAGLTYTPDDVLVLRFRAMGTAPTALAMKVWKQGTLEPKAWQSQATDSTTVLQAPGGVGMMVFLSPASTIFPVTASLDALRVFKASTVAAPPNQSPTASFTSSAANLVASFNGSGSADPDGTIASYGWDFGDGTAGTGVTPPHTYAASGTYQVTLTVTDDEGATGPVTHPITVAANQSPTASFTSSAVNLDASFNGSASADPDGTIASYSWGFGDGTAGTGVTPSHTYALAGTYQVILTVTDNQSATGSVTNPITVTAPPPNQDPTASFTSSSVNLVASFDGSGSSDPDGTITSYSWNFGDGTAAGTGSTPSHTYAAQGSYDVTLTVTDNRGGTAAVTHSVTVSGPVTLASDDFGRTTATGWGTSDLGGAWTTTSAATNFAVSGGVGKITAKTAGAGPSIYLNTVSSTDTDVQTQVSVDVAPSGTAGVDLSLVGRRVGTSGDYRGKVRLMPGGAVKVSIVRADGAGAQTVIVAETVVAGLTYTPGDVLVMRFRAVGTTPTALAMKVWKQGTAEPGWLVQATDSTAVLQAPGGVGVMAYLSAASTIFPVTATYDAIRVYRASTLP